MADHRDAESRNGEDGRPAAPYTWAAMMNPLILFKLAVTPALIALASLAGRRWGPSVGGWLVGLPLTSGPLTFFLAVEQGPAFAAAAATGTLAGSVSQAAFCLAYGWVARSAGWGPAWLGGTAAFAAVTFLWQGLTLDVLPLLAVVFGGLGLALWRLPSARVVAVRAPAPRWDLPARMLLATTVVLGLTFLAPTLGPRLTGLLSPYPVYAAVLAIFAHRHLGAAGAVGVLRGLLYGLFGGSAFFALVALLLPTTGLGLAFGVSIGVALALQGVSGWLLRGGRRGRGQPPFG